MSGIQEMSCRAARAAFDKRVLFGTGVVLTACFWLTIFLNAMTTRESAWAALGAGALAFSLSLSALVVWGILLARGYGTGSGLRQLVKRSWKPLGMALITSLSLLALLFPLWLATGFFLLIGQTPIVGHFLAAVLAFAPFLIVLTMGALCVAAILASRVITPTLALEAGELDLDTLKRSFWGAYRDRETQLLLAGIALAPILLELPLLALARFVTRLLLPSGDTLLYAVTRDFFMAVPAAFLLAPAVAFFFLFSRETRRLASQKLGG